MHIADESLLRNSHHLPGWVPLLFTWEYHIVNQLIPQYKMQSLKLKTKEILPRALVLKDTYNYRISEEWVEKVLQIKSHKLPFT